MLTNQMKRRFGALGMSCAFAALLLSGCAMPTSKVETGGTRPTLALIGAPADATLVLDGAVIGQASLYDGVRRVLTVEEGAHTVEVKRNEGIVLSKKVFASSGETIKIDVANGVNGERQP